MEAIVPDQGLGISVIVNFGRLFKRVFDVEAPRLVALAGRCGLDTDLSPHNWVAKRLLLQRTNVNGSRPRHPSVYEYVDRKRVACFRFERVELVGRIYSEPTGGRGLATSPH